jgi:hypothetical protein
MERRYFFCCGSLHAFACQLVTSTDDGVLLRPADLHAERITVDLLEAVPDVVSLRNILTPLTVTNVQGLRRRHTADVTKYCFQGERVWRNEIELACAKIRQTGVLPREDKLCTI